MNINPSDNVTLFYGGGYAQPGTIPIGVCASKPYPTAILSHIACYLYVNEKFTLINFSKSDIATQTVFEPSNNTFSYMLNIPVSSDAYDSSSNGYVMAQCFYSGGAGYAGQSESKISEPIAIYPPPETPIIHAASLDGSYNINIFTEYPQNTDISYNVYVNVIGSGSNPNHFINFQSVGSRFPPNPPGGYVYTVISLASLELPDSYIDSATIKITMQEVTQYGSTGDFSSTYTVSPINVPIPPAYLNAVVNQNAPSVALSWEELYVLGNNVTYYQINRDGSYLADISANDETYTDPSLNTFYTYVDSNVSPGSSYEYSIAAVYVSPSNRSYYSDFINCTENPVTISEPNPVENLTSGVYSNFTPEGSSPTGEPAIQLNWSRPTLSDVDIVSYNIYRNENNSQPSVPYDTVSDPEQTIYIDPAIDIVIDNTYYYWVQTVGANGGFSTSTETSSYVPIILSPSITDITVDSNAHVVITYVHDNNTTDTLPTYGFPDNNAFWTSTSYTLYKGQTVVDSGTEIFDNTTITFDNLDPDYYRIVITDIGEQETSAETSSYFTVDQPSPPTNLSAYFSGYVAESSTGLPHIGVLLKWEPPSSTPTTIESYNIYRRLSGQSVSENILIGNVLPNLYDNRFVDSDGSLDNEFTDTTWLYSISSVFSSNNFSSLTETSILIPIIEKASQFKTTDQNNITVQSNGTSHTKNIDPNNNPGNDPNFDNTLYLSRATAILSKNGSSYATSNADLTNYTIGSNINFSFSTFHTGTNIATVNLTDAIGGSSSVDFSFNINPLPPPTDVSSGIISNYTDLSNNLTNNPGVKLVWASAIDSSSIPVTNYIIYRQIDTSTNLLPIATVDASSASVNSYIDTSVNIVNSANQPNIYYYAIKSANFTDPSNIEYSNQTTPIKCQMIRIGTPTASASSVSSTPANYKLTYAHNANATNTNPNNTVDNKAYWLNTNYALCNTYQYNQIPNNYLLDKNYSAVASNYNGTILTACANPGYIYVSNNNSAVWNQYGSPNGNWTAIASNFYSSQLIACDSSSGNIYKSIDTGNTWSVSLSSPLSPSTTQWTSVISDATGQYLAACGTNVIYYSTDFGSTWALGVCATTTPASNINHTWSCITSVNITLPQGTSNTNKYLAVCSIDSNVYISNNYGQTWIPYAYNNPINNAPSSPQWSSVCATTTSAVQSGNLTSNMASLLLSEASGNMWYLDLSNNTNAIFTKITQTPPGTGNWKTVKSVACTDASGNSTLFACNSNGNVYSATGLIATGNTKQTWRQLNTPSVNNTWNTMALDNYGNNIILGSTSHVTLLNPNITNVYPNVNSLTFADTSINFTNITSGNSRISLMDLGEQNTITNVFTSISVPYPTPPSALSAGVIPNYTPTSLPAVKLTWNQTYDNSLNITQYQIQKYTTADPSNIISFLIDASSNNSYVDTNVRIGSLYNYTIYSIAGNLSVSQTGSSVNNILISKITAPLDFSYNIPDASNGVVFTWSPPSNTVYDSCLNPISSPSNAAYLSNYVLYLYSDIDHKTGNLGNHATTCTFYPVENNTYTAVLYANGLQDTSAASIVYTNIVMNYQIQTTTPQNLCVIPGNEKLTVSFNNPSSDLFVGIPNHYNITCYDASTQQLVYTSPDIGYVSEPSGSVMYSRIITGLTNNTEYQINVLGYDSSANTNGNVIYTEFAYSVNPPCIYNPFIDISNSIITGSVCSNMGMYYNPATPYENNNIGAEYNDILSGYYVPLVADTYSGQSVTPIQPIMVNTPNSEFQCVGYQDLSNNMVGYIYNFILQLDVSGSSVPVPLDGAVVFFDNLGGNTGSYI